MTAVVGTKLTGTEGFLVESADGDVGHVEEVWPEAVALETIDGAHALLRDEDVLAVDREQHWVVIEAGQRLLELDESHSTTGGTIRAPAQAPWEWPFGLPHWHPLARFARRTGAEWPLQKSILVLYGSLALIACVLLALAFFIPYFITGRPY